MAMRKSVNLTDEDESILGPFLAEDTDERDELVRLTGDDDIAGSDSAALVALARLGATIVRDRMLERGYAEWAAGWGSEDEAFALATARRAR